MLLLIWISLKTSLLKDYLEEEHAKIVENLIISFIIHQKLKAFVMPVVVSFYKELMKVKKLFKCVLTHIISRQNH